MQWNEVLALVADTNQQKLQDNLLFFCLFLSINQQGGC